MLHIVSTIFQDFCPQSHSAGSDGGGVHLNKSVTRNQGRLKPKGRLPNLTSAGDRQAKSAPPVCMEGKTGGHVRE
ncbi:hypothetical protein BaRGS_00010079, partial [Batillaria attramentaria]